jgi:hypothetical protein
MQQTGHGEPEPPASSSRDALAWHPATRGAADEAAISAATRLIARLEEETHTLTTQLAYLQLLLRQVRDTLAVIQHQTNAGPPRDQRGRLLSERLASAQADSYQLPPGNRR